ncbi:MAG: DUF4388 domain-containing protein [Polyangiaceae bacterium]|nr:DUF4388 domain-containing protein [Polyangiaceae bacterium]
MPDPSHDLVRIDDTGTAHPVTRSASQRMRGAAGTFRLMPAPPHVLFLRYVGDDGQRDEDDGAIVKLSGEIVARGTLCDIVAFAGNAGWKGELVVLEGETSRSIFFEGGNVIAATSTAEGERLGEVLYQMGALTEDQVNECMLEAGKRLGDAAVELGFIARDKLFFYMGKQTEEIVYKTLLVGDGMFYFLDRFDESRVAARHNLSAGMLLMEGVRRMDEMGFFRERIPSDEHVPLRVAGKREPEDELRSVWDAVDGERSVTELARHLGMDLFDVTQALFQLTSKGLVKITPPRPTDPVAICETYNAAMRLVFGAIGAERRRELADTLSRFASGSGVYDALFAGAGPLDDGAVGTLRVCQNLSGLAGLDAVPLLAQWLYEYAAFALFAVGSYLATDAEQRLARQVGELIAPLRQMIPSDDGLPNGPVSILVD